MPDVEEHPAAGTGIEETLDQKWAELRSRLDEAAELLAHQGSVASRRAGKARVWSVRFYESVDGRRVQRSIQVGSDAELIQRTAAYLAELRAETDWLRQLPAISRSCRSIVRGLARAKKVVVT